MPHGWVTFAANPGKDSSSMRYVDELTAAVRQQLALAYRTTDLVGLGLRQRFRQGYSLAELKADARAALHVFSLALPLVLALALISGIPPEHAFYGAIVAGFTAPLLGGTRVVVTGPAAALTVVLVPVAATHGTAGVLITTCLAGIILLLMSVARFGRLFQFIPHPVATGLFTGLGVSLITYVLRFALGTAPTPQPIDGAPAAAVALARNVQNGLLRPTEVAVFLTTGLLLLALPRVPRIGNRLPVALVALAVMSLAGMALQRFGHIGFLTIDECFAFTASGETIAGVAPLPPLPQLPWHASGDGALSYALIKTLMPGAFAVAIIGAISAMTSAMVADGISGTTFEPNAELLALGAANVVAPFFGGSAATGALARTTANLRAGATSPLAACIHAVLFLVVLVIAAPLFAHIPIAALAMLLCVVALRLADLRHFVRLLRIAPMSDALIMVTCFVLTIVFDISTAVSVGIVLASLLFMRRMAVLTNVTLDSRISETIELPAGVRLYEIAGPLFFGAARAALANMSTKLADAHTVIISMRGVPTMDATALVAFEAAVARLLRDGKKVVLSGLCEEVAAVLDRAGIVRQPERLMFAPDNETAVAIAVPKRMTAPTMRAVTAPVTSNTPTS